MKHQRQRFPLLVCSLALLVAGCAFETPRYDATFGQASERAKASQAVAAQRASPGMQMGARELHNGMVNYIGDKAAPQAIQGVINSSRGGSGQ